MDLIELVVNAKRMLVARFEHDVGDVHAATMMPIDPDGVPYGPANAMPTSDGRHESHAAVQYDVTVTLAEAKDLATLIGEAVPTWATAARLYVGSASGIVYSTDGTDPAYAAPDATHGVPLDVYDRSGHTIFGAASLAGFRAKAMTADVAVCIELMG